MPRLSKIGAAALAAFGWTGINSVNASYLVVGGGGGGGGLIDGGGGAGGFLTGTVTLSTAQSYTVTVGAGGLGAATYNGVGYQGGNSVFAGNTAIGGGGGGGATQTSLMNGGSGGGRGHGTTGSGGTGTVGQGNNGGGHVYTAPNYPSGGGGGAGAVGGTPASGGSGGGAGGVGLASSISGTSTYYAGGGGGGVYAGGSYGGGGTGGGSAANAGSATANTGGGAGGGSTTNNGGSGIVIISYSGAQKFSGGVVTTSGGNTIHTFNTSGTLGPITTLSASYLIVAGGGGGGYDVGGGGGAGGLLSGSSLTIDPNSTYLVTVGAGGTGATSSVNGVNGSNSTFSMVSTAAVGGGGGASASNTAGSSGGSGGGGTRLSGSGGTGGSGTSGQGNAGGSGSPSSGANVSAAGGGGGAGAVGANASNGAGGNGGIGSTSSISGTSTYYAGGGGGRADGTGTQGTGGSGGGGSAGSAGTAGTANTGGGGGGGSTSGGGNGGSGVVIISYPGSTQQMAGGTVTITGGNVIHTFTSTGYLAPIKYVSNSLRFRSSASAYLSRTFTTPTDGKKWTWSGWVKRGILTAGTGTAQQLFSAGSATAIFRFSTTDTLVSGWTGAANLETTQVFRDPAAWYHIMLVVDTTQATSSNRVKYFVNGVQITAFATTDYPTQNSTTTINSAVAHNIGAYTSSTQYFDGYMTEINFIDGQALTPNSFGTFNSYGVWQPITYGGSYGTNGFYLPFNAQTSSYAGSFNGSNQYLSIASNSVFNQSGDFTIEYYANLTSNTNYQVVVGRGTGFITIQHSSDANAMIRLVRYGQATLATGGNVTAGKWNHFAIVRSGSTVNGYLNGVLVATATDSTSTATGNALAIGQNSDGTNYFTGQISNVRYTNTAVYTSNFTPPTSALTAVTGTQLLTLQNSSIIDNSTNAFSITNNNGVSTGQTYPFAYGIFNDQGPAGNNWTPNNVSGGFGTTLDYMTDVPTLTSATVANYPVLNPLAYGSTGTSVINNGNLSFSNGSAHASITSTMGVTSGKWYFECTVTTSSAGGLGFTTLTTPYSAFPNAVANLWWVYDNTSFFTGFSQTTTLFSIASKIAINQVWQVALDMDNGKAWIGINNTWYDASGGSTGNPSTGANAMFSSIPATNPMFFFVECAGNAWAANFGQRPFTYTPPSGFVALNTYNL
jgi:hypothetical protein